MRSTATFARWESRTPWSKRSGPGRSSPWRRPPAISPRVSPPRPDQLIDTLRRRAQTQEETSLDCRMAASVSDEAVAATHVAMALETLALLQEDMSADDAIMHYVRYFN